MISPENEWFSTKPKTSEKKEVGKESYKDKPMYKFFKNNYPRSLDIFTDFFVSGSIDTSEDYFFDDTDEAKWNEMMAVFSDLELAIDKQGANKIQLKREAAKKLYKIRDRE